jgi:rhamnogalacturonyl hydrolase YesR
MPQTASAGRCAAVALVLGLTANAASADGPYRNRDNPNPADPMEGTYPIPYELPTVPEISADLSRILGYLDSAMPARIVGRDGRTIDPGSAPAADAAADRGEAGAFAPLAYEVGVLHTGMLSAAEATGDRRFSDFTARQLEFIAASLPYFRAQAARFGTASNSFRPILAPAALDDCGAMEAALVQARIDRVGPDLLPVIRAWSDFIARGQFRLPDGAFARRRPQPVSVWSDDFYMGVPALVELSRLDRDPARLDDAVRVVRGMASRLFRPRTGLFTHGWSSDAPDAPDFYWARANGWATLALCDLLDALPPDHPARPEMLGLLRAQLRAVASLQSGKGLWHQMLDRNDSYLETSASAMFVYGIAHAVNRGWIGPVAYGDIAQAGWQALSAQINARGQVENTCVGTTYAGDMAYYYNRPVSVHAVHGYGPVLLAGSEMIRLLENPSIDISLNNRTYRYLPKTP